MKQKSVILIDKKILHKVCSELNHKCTFWQSAPNVLYLLHVFFQGKRQDHIYRNVPIPGQLIANKYENSSKRKIVLQCNFNFQ